MCLDVLRTTFNLKLYSFYGNSSNYQPHQSDDFHVNGNQINDSEFGDDSINHTFDNRRPTDLANGLITNIKNSVNYNSHDQITTLVDENIVRYSKK